jgi:hypothetical protein
MTYGNCCARKIWHTVCTYSWSGELLLAGREERTLAHDRITFKDQPRNPFKVTELDHWSETYGQTNP